MDITTPVSFDLLPIEQVDGPPRAWFYIDDAGEIIDPDDASARIGMLKCAYVTYGMVVQLAESDDPKEWEPRLLNVLRSSLEKDIADPAVLPEDRLVWRRLPAFSFDTETKRLKLTCRFALTSWGQRSRSTSWHLVPEGAPLVEIRRDWRPEMAK